MKKTTVMICDGDRDVRVGVKSYLSGENYEVLTAESTEEIIDALDHRSMDLLIMETQLPDGDGYELCRRIRGRSNIPIIFLSRRNEEFDRVLGLKIGADDYMGKPFSLRELSARVEALLRRAIPMPEAEYIQVAELTVYPDAFSAYVAGKKVELIPSDFKLLYYFTTNIGKVLSREKLLDAVWGIESYGSQRSIDTQIKRIRRAICLPNVHFAIRSIYGVGYKMELIM